jgi:predicted enzyme related to lactoylglutathione lyase
MTLSLAMITIDTTDAEKLGGWWSEQLGGVITETNGGWYVIVKVEEPSVLLSFQKVEDPTPGKNKVHLDVMAEDLDAEVERLLSVGASMVERRGDESFRWVTLADPDGNEFCVAGRQQATSEFDSAG